MPCYNTDDLPTRYTYTGQYTHADTFGLLFYNARYYSPALGRFVSADSLVQNPFYPQAFDRYAYVWNNPLIYLDPSGHFTEDAVQKYLYSYYLTQCDGNTYCAAAQARSRMSVWKSDREWWTMLMTAQAGDVLFGGAGFGPKGEVQFGEMYEFQGEGEDVLSGITPYQGRGDPDVTPMDIQQGFKQTADLPPGYGVSRTWYGIFRIGDSTVQFWWRDGYTKTDYYTPENIRNITKFLWSLGMTVAGLATPASIAVKGTLALVGISLTVNSLPDFYLDIRDMEANDVNVRIGPAYFNFQFSIEAGWTLEKYELR